MVSIQAGASIAKHLFADLGVEGTTFLRIGFASLMLSAIWKPWRRKVRGAEWRAILPYGVSLGTMNLLFYLALSRIPLGIAVAIEFTGPLAVAIYLSRKPLDFVWAAFALAGILLVMPVTLGAQALDPLGVVLALGAGVCWALYIVYGKRAGTSIHAGVVSSLGMFVAALVVAPFGIFVAGDSLFQFQFWPLALAVALLSSAIPYSLEMVALKKLSSKHFGILLSLEPALGAVSGFLILGEVLTGLQWIAICCVVVACVGSSATSRSTKLV